MLEKLPLNALNGFEPEFEINTEGLCNMNNHCFLCWTHILRREVIAPEELPPSSEEGAGGRNELGVR